MGFLRSAVCSTAIGSLLSFGAYSPTYAGDRGAAFGAGFGLGLLGAALAEQQRRAPFPRGVYIGPRQRYMTMPRVTVERAPKFARKDVVTDEPTVTRFYWNCVSTRRLNNITARADHGYIKESFSTRLACGNLRQSVKVFTYLSQNNYVGQDRITYIDAGKTSFIDYVQVGRFNKSAELVTNIVANTNEDHDLMFSSGCTRSAMQAKADAGFAMIRESRSADSSCTGGQKVIQTVVYRSFSGFVGGDHVAVYSSTREPIVFNISVLARPASEPVAAEPPPVERTMTTEQPITPQGPAATQIAQNDDCDMFLFKANAFFVRATTFCSKNYMDSEAGYAALEGARRCSLTRGESIKPQIEQTMRSLDRIAVQRGKAVACEVVENVASRVLQRTARLRETVSANSKAADVRQSASEPQLTYPEFQKGENYQKLRTKLLALGWKPVRAQVDTEVCVGDDPRCKNYPEVEACAGSGDANCKFVWHSANGQLLEVNTVGESEPTVDSIGRKSLKTASIKAKGSTLPAAPSLADMAHQPSSTDAVKAPLASSTNEFAAAVGHKGYGRCHMDACSWFIIDRATAVGTGRDGVLFKIDQRAWGAEYYPPPANASANFDEYARPPKSISKPERETLYVFCSKVNPTTFNYGGGVWSYQKLRPGDGSAIAGYNESAYTWYYAACHNAILRNPYDDHKLPQRLGYKFGQGDGDPSDDQGSMSPFQLLK